MRFVKNFIMILPMLLLALAAGGSAPSINGEGPVDLVDINVRKDSTDIVVHFTRPVFYVYHTPQTEGNSLLIGVQDSGIYGRNTGGRIRQVISFNRKLAPFIDSMEYISEDGFPPYIMIDFHRKCRYQVKNERDMRSLVVTVFTSTKPQEDRKP